MEKRSVAKRALTLTGLLLILALLFVALPASSVPNGSVWVLTTGNCIGNLVCADWVEDGVIQYDCCIHPRHISTSYEEACYTGS